MDARPADTAALTAVVRDPRAAPADVRHALDVLLVDDPVRGSALAFGLLAAGPRVKPTIALVIDPGDSVHRRWSHRVQAAAALLSAPDAGRWAAEVHDELADEPDLAVEVAAAVRPGAAAPG